MPTDQQITAIAREYAEWVTEAEGGNKAYIPAEQAIASAFLRWLSQRYCPVEKSRASDLCRLTLEHGDSVDYGLIDGLTDIVWAIFPEQYQQVEEEFNNPEIAKEVEG